MKRAATIQIDSVLAEVLRSGAAGPTGGDPDATTSAILDATAALLAEHGVRGWSVDDVAARAGTGRATVYRRFPGRDDLVRATLARDAHRFFAAITASVRDVDSLEDKVLGGFLAGLSMARRSPLGSLLRRDPAAALSVVTSEPLLQSATTALADRYEKLLGRPLAPRERSRAEAGAEALIRLGLSYLLAPGPTADPAGRRAARAHLAAVLGPLLGGAAPPVGGDSPDPDQRDRI